MERNLTRKSRFFKQITENGFGLLWRKIDGSLTWKVDPKPQNPSPKKAKYVARTFKSAPYFRKFIAEYKFGPVPNWVYRKFQEKQADRLIGSLTKKMTKFYISICHVGTMLEPQAMTLVTYSTKPLNISGNINTTELEKWLTIPEIVYIVKYVGYDERWKGLEKLLQNNTLTVGEALAQKDRVLYMAYNMSRDLNYCRIHPKMFCKEQIIKEVLKELRKKKS